MTSFKNALSDNAFESDMYRAIYSGNVEKVNSIIDSFNSSYLLPWEESQKYLTSAIQCGRLEIAKILLEKGCDIGDTLSPTMKLYPDVLLCGDVELVKLLLDKDPQSLNKTLHGDTLLHLAVHLDIDAMVKLFIDHGANVNLVDSDGLFPLHVAAKRGNLVILKLLLDAGASTESKSLCSGETSLLFAMNNFLINITIEQRYEIVSQLVDSGADLNQRNCLGQTPLHIACFFNDSSTIDLLLNAGADVNALDNKGMVPSVVFTEKMSPCNRSFMYDYIPFPLLIHLISLREAGLYLDDNNKFVVDNYKKCYCKVIFVANVIIVYPASNKHFIGMCRKEINLMKGVKTSTGSLLYGILKKLNSSPLHTATDVEIELLKLVILQNKFPLYTIILNFHLKYVLLRRCLLPQAQDCLASLIELSKIKIPFIPEEIRIHIVSYLKNCELNVLINTAALVKSENYFKN